MKDKISGKNKEVKLQPTKKRKFFIWGRYQKPIGDSAKLNSIFEQTQKAS